MAAATENANLKIGFLGLGIMGVAMARNLMKAGYSVTVWNRSPDKCKELEGEGASVAGSAADCVAASDITVAMLADPAAALAVARDAASGLAAGKGYVDASTVDAGTAQQVSQIVKEAGSSYLEAPVSGSKQPAEQGTLIFLCGGDQALFDKAGPLLDVMGKAKLFLGNVGNGANMKLVVNMIMGAFMVSSAEGLELAKGVGLKEEDLIEVVNMAAIATPMFKLKAPSMVQGKYPTAFPLKHQQKDMRLALEAAEQSGIMLPVAAAANDMYKKAMDGGRGDEDFSAVKESLHIPNRPNVDMTVVN